MNILIVGDFPFPTGAASSVRVRNMALGLQECGAQVRVLSLSPVIVNENAKASSTYQGIEYQLLAQITPGASKIIKVLARYRAVFAAKQLIKQAFLKGLCDALIVYDRGISRIPALMLGLPTSPDLIKILDVVEYYSSSELFGSLPEYWEYQLGEGRIQRLFDGFTVITTTLNQLYKQRGFENVLTFPHVEQWGNLTIPAPINKDTQRPFQLTYVGAMLVRDNPESLHRIMQHLFEQGVDIHLNIIGYFERLPYGHEMAQKFRDPAWHKGRVHLLGAFSDESLQEHLRQSDGLILPRRNASSEIYAFPTRLLEYLQHGHPVFAARVGDISNYLKDNEDAILFDPDDSLKAAQTIAAALNDPKRLYAIGLNGQKKAAQIFERKHHAQNLLNFIELIRVSKQNRHPKGQS